MIKIRIYQSFLLWLGISFLFIESYRLPSQQPNTNNILNTRMITRKTQPLSHPTLLPTRSFLLKATELPPINENIQYEEVRLLIARSNGEPDDMVGIVTIDEALDRARELDLDLVLINDSADPPVCKIIDYGKYRYEIEKRRKENLKKQAKAGDLKEIKMSYLIEQHDFDVRVKQIKKFITDGDRVRVTVIFKGREMQNAKLGEELLNRVFEPVSSIGIMESPPTIEGKTMLMMIGPKRSK